jgi:hypothetical protein
MSVTAGFPVLAGGDDGIGTRVTLLVSDHGDWSALQFIAPPFVSPVIHGRLPTFGGRLICAFRARSLVT